MEEVFKTLVRAETVSIKILCVGKKKMSAALYRQFPVKDLIDPETNELNGIPWGIVQYQWLNCCEFGRSVRWEQDIKHSHILWEKNGQLFICPTCGVSAKILEDLDQLFVGS